LYVFSPVFFTPLVAYDVGNRYTHYYRED